MPLWDPCFALALNRCCMASFVKKRASATGPTALSSDCNRQRNTGAVVALSPDPPYRSRSTPASAGTRLWSTLPRFHSRVTESTTALLFCMTRKPGELRSCAVALSTQHVVRRSWARRCRSRTARTTAPTDCFRTTQRDAECEVLGTKSSVVSAGTSYLGRRTLATNERAVSDSIEEQRLSSTRCSQALARKAAIEIVCIVRRRRLARHVEYLSRH